MENKETIIKLWEDADWEVDWWGDLELTKMFGDEKYYISFPVGYEGEYKGVDITTSNRHTHIHVWIDSETNKLINKTLELLGWL